MPNSPHLPPGDSSKHAGSSVPRLASPSELGASTPGLGGKTISRPIIMPGVTPDDFRGGKPQRFITNARYFERKGVDAKLPVELDIGEHAFRNGLKEKTIERILDIASRRKEFPRDSEVHRGRSIIVPLERDEVFRVGRKTIKFIKLKQVGYRGEQPKMIPYDQDKDAYSSGGQSKIIGRWNPTGVEEFFDAPPVPIGGGYLEWSQTEYQTAGTVFISTGKTSYPMGVGKFPTLNFTRHDPRSLGFCILGLETNREKRVADSLVQDVAQLNSNKSPEQYRSGASAAFRRFATAVKLSAETLRELHEIGIIHANPHLGQFAYGATNGIEVFDFQTSKMIENLDREQFVRSVWGDLNCFNREAVKYLTGNAYEALCKATATICDPEELIVNAILDGYFTTDEIERFGRARLFEMMTPGAIDDLLTTDFASHHRHRGKILSQIKEVQMQVLSQVGSEIYTNMTPYVSIGHDIGSISNLFYRNLNYEFVNATTPAVALRELVHLEQTVNSRTWRARPIFQKNGELRPDLELTLNGQRITTENATTTLLSEGDHLSLHRGKFRPRTILGLKF